MVIAFMSKTKKPNLFYSYLRGQLPPNYRSWTRRHDRMHEELERLEAQMLLVVLLSIEAERVVKDLRLQLRDLLRREMAEYLDIYPF
jgi:hypothetical protein